MTALTALGQHSMVPPFYANRAKVALRATTAREAPSMSKVNSEHAFESRRCPAAQPGTTNLGQHPRSHANTTIGHQNAMLRPL